MTRDLTTAVCFAFGGVLYTLFIWYRGYRSGYKSGCYDGLRREIQSHRDRSTQFPRYVDPGTLSGHDAIDNYHNTSPTMAEAQRYYQRPGRSDDRNAAYDHRSTGVPYRDPENGDSLLLVTDGPMDGYLMRWNDDAGAWEPVRTATVDDKLNAERQRGVRIARNDDGS